MKRFVLLADIAYIADKGGAREWADRRRSLRASEEVLARLKASAAQLLSPYISTLGDDFRTVFAGSRHAALDPDDRAASAAADPVGR